MGKLRLRMARDQAFLWRCSTCPGWPALQQRAKCCLSQKPEGGRPISQPSAKAVAKNSWSGFLDNFIKHISKYLYKEKCFYIVHPATPFSSTLLWDALSCNIFVLFWFDCSIIAGSWKKQESSRKTSIFALLTMPKPLTVWITINCGKFWKRWEYQTNWSASWEICMQVKKQQLELDMEQQTGSK